jgi:hypothetical protein
MTSGEVHGIAEVRVPFPLAMRDKSPVICSFLFMNP